MATATARPVIPAPDTELIVAGALRSMLAVQIDNLIVVYAYDSLSVTLSIINDAAHLWAMDLHYAIKEGRSLGVVALRTELEEGGSLMGDLPDVETDLQRAALIAAISHFYPCAPNSDERKALRMIYARLIRGAGRKGSDD